MTDEEFQLILRHSGPEFRRVMIYLRFTGCRPCEMSSVEWSFVDFTRGIVTHEKHKTAKTRRDRKPRVIFLHPVALNLLLWIRRHNPPDRLVFVNTRGGAWTRYNLATRMKRLRKKLGLRKECKTYGTRHAWGRRAILNGVELKTVSVLLGHTSVRCTERYTDIEGDIDHLRGAAKKVFDAKKH